MFAIQKNLRVERGRQRSERQVVAKHKGRSAAELAIMFMGINQQAYDIMKENPMVGYSSEIVFSRILVNNEGIQEAIYWTDSTYCWICSAFQKIELTYDIKEDRTAFHERLNELKKLKMTMETCVNAKETENHFCVRKNVEKAIRQNKSLNKTVDYFAHSKDLSHKTLVAP